MKLFQTGEDKILQNCINKNNIQVFDLQKLSQLNGILDQEKTNFSSITIDKITIKFYNHEEKENLKEKYNVEVYLEPEVNKMYIKDFKKTAAGFLEKDFKKNYDSIYGLYKIIKYNHKFVLLRKVFDDTKTSIDLQIMDPEEKDEYINSNKSIFNINYKGSSYSIIKIINEGSYWSEYQKLTTITSINYFNNDEDNSEENEENNETENMIPLF